MKSLLFSLNANQQKIELAYISCLMEMCELWRLIQRSGGRWGLLRKFMRTLSNWHSFGWEYCTFGSGGGSIICDCCIQYSCVKQLSMWTLSETVDSMEESTLALAQSLAKQVKLKLAQNQSESILCNLSLSYKTLIGCRRSTKSRHLGPLELLAATPPSLQRRCRGSGKRTLDYKSIWYK